MGKILPAIKPPENLGAQFGPVGAKPPLKPVWNNSGRGSVNDLNDGIHNNGFPGINGVQNNGSGGNGVSGNSNSGNGNNEDMFTGSNNSNGSSPSRTGPSLMTQLQMNRKQETAQFLAGLTRNDWPGFNEAPSTSGGNAGPPQARSGKRSVSHQCSVRTTGVRTIDHKLANVPVQSSMVKPT